MLFMYMKNICVTSNFFNINIMLKYSAPIFIIVL